MARNRAFLTAAFGAPLAILAAPVVAQASLAMLDSLDKGGWELRFRDGATARKLCVRSGRELIQLRHSGENCNRFVVQDSADEITVQYTCRGNGYGRTHIRIISNGKTKKIFYLRILKFFRSQNFYCD